MRGGLESPPPCFQPVEFCDGLKQPVGGRVDLGAKLGDLVLEFVDGASVNLTTVETRLF